MAGLFQIDLRECLNSGCESCTSTIKSECKANNHTCTSVVSALDGMPIRCVGAWAYKKIFYLSQYFGIFTAVGKKWNGKLNYLEVCSGPGRCILRGTKQEVDGTPLCILNHDRFQHIQSAVFIDNNSRTVDTLGKRIALLSAEDKARAFIADYSDAEGLQKAIDVLPKDSLNLVFIDPSDCSIPFTAIKQIVDSLSHVDLLINFGIYTDLNRNITDVVLNPEKFLKAYSKYVSFLGSTSFFSDDEVISLAKIRKHGMIRQKFRDKYIAQLSTLGFKYFDRIPPSFRT